VSIKYTTIFHCNTLQNLPKFGFGFENKPSGNPARAFNLRALLDMYFDRIRAKVLKHGIVFSAYKWEIILIDKKECVSEITIGDRKCPSLITFHPLTNYSRQTD
jgi:hypothetical protein